MSKEASCELKVLELFSYLYLRSLVSERLRRVEERVERDFGSFSTWILASLRHQRVERRGRIVRTSSTIVAGVRPQ